MRVTTIVYTFTFIGRGYIVVCYTYSIIKYNNSISINKVKYKLYSKVIYIYIVILLRYSDIKHSDSITKHRE